MSRTRVGIKTVGCRANQADSGQLVGHLDPGLIEVVSGLDDVDVAIINTCCVTAEAERDCRKAARRALRASPDARVVLVGCAVTAFEEFGRDIDPRVERRGGRDAEPRAVAAWVNEMVGSSEKGRRRATSFGGRTRALLKIQTGCSHGCTYCIVPRARGPERSYPANQVIEETTRLVAEGFREVVITGVQLGAWGSDLDRRSSLTELLPAVAEAARPGRVRLSSIEPWSVSEALVEALAASPNVCPHLHLPLQSGDDEVLGAMRRGYTAAEYLDLADRVRRRLPEVALGTDVIAGFPGEDEAAFRRSLDVLEELGPAYVHAFSYSPRSGTRAARFPDRPSREVAKRRTRELRAFGDATSARFRESQVGKVRQIIVEEVSESEALGLTDNFLRVVLPRGDHLAGELKTARIEGVAPDGERLLAVVTKS